MRHRAPTVGEQVIISREFVEPSSNLTAPVAAVREFDDEDQTFLVEVDFRTGTDQSRPRTCWVRATNRPTGHPQWEIVNPHRPRAAK